MARSISPQELIIGKLRKYFYNEIFQIYGIIESNVYTYPECGIMVFQGQSLKNFSILHKVYNPYTLA